MNPLKSSAGKSVATLSSFRERWDHVYSSLRSPLLCMCVHAKSLHLCQTLQPYGLKPTRLLCPWDSPGKNAGVGCQASPGVLPRDQTHISHVSCIGRRVLYHWGHWEIQYLLSLVIYVPVHILDVHTQNPASSSSYSLCNTAFLLLLLTSPPQHPSTLLPACDCLLSS